MVSRQGGMAESAGDAAIISGVLVYDMYCFYLIGILIKVYPLIVCTHLY